MATDRAERRWGGFDALSLASLAAFFSSVPLLLAPLGMLRPLLVVGASGPVLEPLGETPFLTALALAAMFVSLAMLFVCLLKTAYARLGRGLLLSAALAYLVGMLVVCASPFIGNLPPTLFLVVGALVGAGAAVLCMAWARQTHLPDFRRALASLVVLGGTIFVIDALVLLLDVRLRAISLFVLACAGTLGCLRAALSGLQDARATTSGSNWWDVFGRLDLSLLESGSEFASLASRTLFFIVAPAVLFLLFITDMNIHNTTYSDMSVEIVGGLVAVACTAPLLLIKTERGMISAAFRFYLPTIAIVVFVVGDFAPIDLRPLLLNVGVYAFCFVYGLFMCGLVITMLSRMQSLALPAACMLTVAASFIALLSYANIDAGSLAVFRHYLLLGLLLTATVLLVVMPSSRIWRLVLQGVDEASGLDRAAAGAGEGASSATLEQRCEAIAAAYGLTARESEILHFLGRGYGAPYIAETLVIADSTVRSHVKNIYRKLDVSSRAELISRIDEMGETPREA